MPKLLDFNPLKSIAVPNVGRIEPKGLVLVIGPNSAGKTQLLRDIQGLVLGQARKLVVCDDVEISRPPSLDPLLDVLFAENHIRRRVDENNNVYIEPRIPTLGGTSRTGPCLRTRLGTTSQLRAGAGRPTATATRTSSSNTSGGRSSPPCSSTGG
jgi:energy-coupling factor transporter ATP-binding protein EcfA2